MAAIAIPKLVSKNSKSETKKATEDVRSLSAEIYNLQKSTTAIKTAISEFENLDKKVIKTKEDIEAMNKALTEGGNALTDEQKKYYNTLGDNQKLEYLKQVKEINEKAIVQKGALQLQTIDSAGASEMLKESSNQAVVFDIITEKAYEYIDSLQELGQITSEEADNMSRFTKQLISNMDAYELYTNYIDKNFSDLGKGESKFNTELAEKEAKEKALKAERKQRAEEVNAAYKAIKEAEKHYCELRDQFVKDYGSFHMTFTDTGSFFFDPFRFTIL